jgi:hypothetical protein
VFQKYSWRVRSRSLDGARVIGSQSGGSALFQKFGLEKQREVARRQRELAFIDSSEWRSMIYWMLPTLLVAALLGAALSDLTGSVVDASGGSIVAAKVTVERASGEPLSDRLRALLRAVPF